MASKGSGKDKPAASAAPKKANLLDPHALKHLLDETASEESTLCFNRFLVGFQYGGLAISSKLPRCSDMYTICISSSDPESISSNPPVELTKSVTKWFTKDGILVEGLFWKDVEKLIDDYSNESRKTK